MYSLELSPRTDESKKLQASAQDGLFPIEAEIAQRLYGICIKGFAASVDKSWESNRHWTKQVLETLAELGDSRGMLIYPQKDTDGHFREQWLFDMVWVDAGKGRDGLFDYSKTRGLKLACESEWNSSRNAILNDFLKLTFALADLRLFIYTNKLTSYEGKQVTPTNLCKDACPLSKGFRYLLVGFPPNVEGIFRIDAWTV